MMIEKYFELREDCELSRNYKQYLIDTKKKNELYNQLKKEFGIESDHFGTTRYRLCIRPTENDLEKYSNQFRKSSSPNKDVKKGSKIFRYWEKLIKESDIEVFEMPRVRWFFNIRGMSTSRIFQGLDNKVYCEITFHEDDVFNTDIAAGIATVKEIKASHYYKVLEAVRESESEANGYEVVVK